MLGNVLNSFYLFNLQHSLRCGDCYFPHFSNGETEARSAGGRARRPPEMESGCWPRCRSIRNHSGYSVLASPFMLCRPFPAARASATTCPMVRSPTSAGHYHFLPTVGCQQISRLARPEYTNGPPHPSRPKGTEAYGSVTSVSVLEKVSSEHLLRDSGTRDCSGFWSHKDRRARPCPGELAGGLPVSFLVPAVLRMPASPRDPRSWLEMPTPDLPNQVCFPGRLPQGRVSVRVLA